MWRFGSPAFRKDSTSLLQPVSGACFLWLSRRLGAVAATSVWGIFLWLAASNASKILAWKLKDLRMSNSNSRLQSIYILYETSAELVSFQWQFRRALSPNYAHRNIENAIRLKHPDAFPRWSFYLVVSIGFLGVNERRFKTPKGKIQKCCGPKIK